MPKDSKKTNERTGQEAGTVRVRVSASPEGRWRAGKRWQGTQVADVTPEDLKALKADPRLAVVELDGGVDFDGLGLDELASRASEAVAAYDNALKAIDPEAGAALTVTEAREAQREAHSTAQAGQRKGQRGKGAPEAAQGQEGGKEKEGGTNPTALPDDFPFVELFKAAGKTPADVLALSAESKLATVTDIGPARAAEVQAWIDANPGKLGG